MSARLLDGNALARQYREQIAQRVQQVRQRGGHVRLAAILVDTGDHAARLYAEHQGRTCAALGIEYDLHRFDAGTTGEELAACIARLNARPDVSGIMVHLPLPPAIRPVTLQRLIAPDKDVEGVNPVNIGNIVYGLSSLIPCTALAVLKMIEHTGLELRGRRAVVIGASDVVGKPVAVLLMRAEATVISCNKYTLGLADLTLTADVLVAAAGVPHLVTADMVRPGAVVIDVGVNRVPDPADPARLKTVGDVDFERVQRVAGWLSPVPGGVGPMTVAMLLLNVVEAAERRLAPSPHESDPDTR